MGCYVLLFHVSSPPVFLLQLFRMKTFQSWVAQVSLVWTPFLSSVVKHWRKHHWRSHHSLNALLHYLVEYLAPFLPHSCRWTTFLCLSSHTTVSAPWSTRVYMTAKNNKETLVACYIWWQLTLTVFDWLVQTLHWHSADVSAFWLWLCVWLACTDVTGTLTVFGCLVQTLHEAFSRCASVLSHSSQPDDVAVQVNHCHCGQIGYQSQRAGRNGWLRAVEARMRVVGGESSGWFSVTEDEKLRVKFGAKELSFLRCFDTAGWATGSHVACINLFQLSANTLFWGLSQTAVTPEKKKAG